MWVQTGKGFDYHHEAKIQPVHWHFFEDWCALQTYLFRRANECDGGGSQSQTMTPTSLNEWQKVLHKVKRSDSASTRHANRVTYTKILYWVDRQSGSNTSSTDMIYFFPEASLAIKRRSAMNLVNWEMKSGQWTLVIRKMLDTFGEGGGGGGAWRCRVMDQAIPTSNSRYMVKSKGKFKTGAASKMQFSLSCNSCHRTLKSCLHHPRMQAQRNEKWRRDCQAIFFSMKNRN